MQYKVYGFFKKNCIFLLLASWWNSDLPFLEQTEKLVGEGSVQKSLLFGMEKRAQFSKKTLSLSPENN